MQCPKCKGDADGPFPITNPDRKNFGKHMYKCEPCKFFSFVAPGAVIQNKRPRSDPDVNNPPWIPAVPQYRDESDIVTRETQTATITKDERNDSNRDLCLKLLAEKIEALERRNDTEQKILKMLERIYSKLELNDVQTDVE